MSSYLWWGANQLARISSTWVATHPAETGLILAGLGNRLTRGFVWDTLKSLGWRTTQMTGHIALDMGKSLIRRSPKAAATARGVTSFGRFLARHPIGTVVAMDLAAAGTAITLAQDPDPATESTQVRSTGFSFGGLGSWGIGTGGSSLIG